MSTTGLLLRLMLAAVLTCGLIYGVFRGRISRKDRDWIVIGLPSLWLSCLGVSLASHFWLCCLTTFPPAVLIVRTRWEALRQPERVGEDSALPSRGEAKRFFSFVVVENACVMVLVLHYVIHDSYVYDRFGSVTLYRLLELGVDAVLLTAAVMAVTALMRRNGQD